MKLPLQLLRRFVPKPHRRLSIGRNWDKRLNTELAALRHAEASPIAMASSLDAVRSITPPMVSVTRRPSRRWILPKICYAAALSFVVITAGYWMYIERDPIVSEVIHDDASMLSAYDTYTALAQSVDLDKIAQLPFFDKSGNWKETLGDSSDADKRYPFDRHQRLKIAEDILKQNKREIQTLRSALNVPYINKDRWKPETDSLRVRSFQKLWSLLMLDTYVESEHGNHAQAVMAALDALQFATQLQTNTLVFPKLLAMSWENTPRAFLWKTLPALNASELRNVLGRLDALLELSKQTTLSRILVNERIQGHQRLLNSFHERNWRWQADVFSQPDERSQTEIIWSYLQTCRYSKRQIYADFDAAITKEIERSQSNFFKPQSQFSLPHTADTISKFFMPVYDSVRFSDAVSRTQNEFLMTTASILLYKQEKGIHPASLADLSHQEKLLKNNGHIDPFAFRDKTPPALRYILKNNDYVLYSIGPDMKDDGGVMLINSHNHGAKNAILVESKGDIVAGINRHWR